MVMCGLNCSAGWCRPSVQARLLADTKVVVDALQDDPEWAPKSIAQLRAQAAVQGWTLLTRDASRFRSHLPTLQVIAP